MIQETRNIMRKNKVKKDDRIAITRAIENGTIDKLEPLGVAGHFL